MHILGALVGVAIVTAEIEIESDVQHMANTFMDCIDLPRRVICLSW
jgi:hypothetical protein